MTSSTRWASAAAPVNWPVGNAENFRGVYDIHRKHLLLYEREWQGQYRAPVDVADLDDPEAKALIGDSVYEHFPRVARRDRRCRNAVQRDRLSVRARKHRCSSAAP